MLQTPFYVVLMALRPVTASPDLPGLATKTCTAPCVATIPMLTYWLINPLILQALKPPRSTPTPGGAPPLITGCHPWIRFYASCLTFLDDGFT